ncbi:radical SAM/SPASM domain-containing protein [Pedobacter caeni]|uniref:Radical SAM core domain-containing protein n=1 Tax=Pedobacter caeni TaxID=288992 RepID=A0A1M5M323_9SPHI|nr:radical SAM protein [Pedobacter caeni]SHG71616.1 uncharacterized protein SAMN04488522_10746 [Pedobacter caeni]
MKNSLFNHFLLIDNSHILYNTLTNSVLLLEPALVDLYKAAVAENDVDGLGNYHPTFFQKLLEDRYIVTDDANEIEEVREIMNRVDADEFRYHLVINPTMNCNFKCWYCYESHIKDSKMDLSTINNIVKHLDQVLSANSKINEVIISWFGGEPLLYFEKVMLPIYKEIDLLKEKYKVTVSSNITTNGFLIKENMIAEFKKYDLNDFQITLDGNRFLHDTVRFVSKSRGSYDDIVHNMKLLARNEFRVIVRINYTKTNLPDIEEIYEDFQDLTDADKRFLTFNLHKVWQEEDQTLNDRADEVVSFFRTKGLKGGNAYVPDTLQNSCYADRSNHATVNYDGKVFKCTARDFSDTNSEGVINEDGEIVWNHKYHDRMSIKLKNKPCHTCNILPLCNGGCSQAAIEANGEDYCVFDFDQKVKDDIVYRKVKNILL